jgi:hypothetical protein
MKIIALGASVMAGAELKDHKSVWPGLYAKLQGFEFKNLSYSGCSTQYVLRTLLSSLQEEVDSCFYVIHWPHSIRFEYVNKEDDSWIQLGPTMENDNLVKKVYYGDINSYLGDKWSTLLIIYAAQQAISNTHHRFAMTLEDGFVYETEFHNPDYISFLQDQTKKSILWFEEKSWSNWTRDNQYPIGPDNHPLEPAHQAALDLFLPSYKKILSN